MIDLSILRPKRQMMIQIFIYNIYVFLTIYKRDVKWYILTHLNETILLFLNIVTLFSSFT